MPPVVGASMGPRLGRVEYDVLADVVIYYCGQASMGPRLGRVEYGTGMTYVSDNARASMGPRLGRVEYRA